MSSLKILFSCEQIFEDRQKEILSTKGGMAFAGVYDDESGPALCIELQTYSGKSFALFYIDGEEEINDLISYLQRRLEYISLERSNVS